MIRQTVAHIDLDALQSNFRALADFVAAGRDPAHTPQVIGVVKANAYGHGAVPVARALESAGAGMFACADIEEAVLLREGGIAGPILVFGALSVSDLDGIFTHRLTPTISTPSAARALQLAASRRGVTLRCHLKIDTGMNRLGFRHDNVRRTLPEIAASPNLAIDAVYTHFATADNLETPLYEEQRLRFEAVMPILPEIGIHSRLRHAANSAALLRDERVWFDLVRPGLLLYGIAPPPLATTIPLRPVMSLRSRVVAVKGLRPGESVGYGARHQADRPQQIAVIPAGYADGLDLRLAGTGFVLIDGRRAPIVGSVCMDMMTVDVTDLSVSPGMEVVLIGDQGTQRIDVREMAAAIGTIPYEILCRIGTRIERVYG